MALVVMVPMTNTRLRTARAALQCFVPLLFLSVGNCFTAFTCFTAERAAAAAWLTGAARTRFCSEPLGLARGGHALRAVDEPRDGRGGFLGGFLETTTTDLAEGAAGSREKMESKYERGFSFSVAGLIFPYHLGVIEELKSARLLTTGTPLAGSSGGALAAAFTGM